MEEYESEGPKPWSMYTASSEPSPSQNGGGGGGGVHREGPFKNLGTSMSAISFGFLATAVLISMFLIMAIFEHLFRPNNNASFISNQIRTITRSSESRPGQKKPRNPRPVSTSYGSDFSVLMPGQQCPTYIAQPAPLPCPREGAYWPPHQ
ncbi:hypothetical protein LguiA_027007 [Lonicera macranthoides]